MAFNNANNNNDNVHIIWQNCDIAELKLIMVVPGVLESKTVFINNSP